MLRRAAFVLLYAAGRLGEAAGAVLHYAAAGTLSLADLRAGTVARWSAFGAMESEGHRDSGLMQWERTLYLAALKPGERVLSVGCGTGRDVIALLRAGYQVDGIDTAADCVEAARRAVATRGLVAWLAPGALETVTLPARYDGIIFSWYCYSYIPGAAARIGALRHAREALTDGGRVLISYLSIGNSRRYPLIAITRAVARLTGSDWRAERGDVVLLSSPRRRRVHYEHHFAPSELEAEARAAGLRVALHDVPDDGHVVLVRE